MPGELQLTRRPGSRNWYIRGTGNAGESIFASTKTHDEATARSILVKAQARLLTEAVHGKVATTTFQEAATAYVEAGGEARFISQQDAAGNWHGLAHHFGPAKKLMDITQADLDGAARAICGPKAGRETLIRNVYTPFIAVWNFAATASRKWAEPRQWERPKKAKGTAQRAKATRAGTAPIPYERAWRFVSAMSPAGAQIVTAFFYSGVRPIEYFALDATEVNVDGRWIVLLGSKTDEPRGVPMHEMLVPMFRALVGDALAREGNKRVFLNHHGEPYRITDNEAGINGQLKGAIKGARGRLAGAGYDMDDVSPYTARHTVSTQLVMNGIHPYVKDQILGHVADDMSRHYTAIPQQPLIDAINTLPTIEAWANAEWLTDPVTWRAKLTRWENRGRAGRGAAANDNEDIAA